MPLKLSVVIPTCHRNDDLALCLDRLSPGVQTLPVEEYEVIVTDDGSDTTAEAMIAERYPWVRWTAGPRRGPAANRNRGASLALSDWIVFTDDDCLPEPSWLAEYANHIDGQYDVLEGRTSPYGTRTRVDQECPSNETGGYLWACNFAIRKCVFQELEGFNEGFPVAAYEDMELNTRIELRCFRRLFLPDAAVLHPWRRKKPISFYRSRAKSVAHYVAIHPHMGGRFCTTYKCRALVQFFLRDILPNSLRYRGRGTLQAIAKRFVVDLATLIELWKQAHQKEKNNGCDTSSCIYPYTSRCD